MDDVQNVSAPLYGKAEPTTAKTTMSVREMQHLLGLGKTDSYWLLHKNFFEVILINDKCDILCTHDLIQHVFHKIQTFLLC